MDLRPGEYLTPNQPGAVDVHEHHYAMTREGRTIHIYVGDLPAGDYLGRPAICGRKVTRLVHPSDHRDGGRICRQCARLDGGTR